MKKDSTTAEKRIIQLRSELNQHNNRYYIDNNPTIEDFQFDMLLRELQELEQEYPQFIDENSPSNKVGSDRDNVGEEKYNGMLFLVDDSKEAPISNKFQNYTHRYQMLSLANTYSKEELNDFCRKIEQDTTQDVEYVCELKFDGTAISITYENGKLLRAVTRGDGTVGDDVTANVRTIKSVPLVLSGVGFPDYFEVRGEIILPYSSFDNLNKARSESGEQLFANPRNAAAGTLKLQNPSVVAERNLDCYLYNIAGNDASAETHYDTLLQMGRWGFKVSNDIRLCKGIDEIWEYIESIDELRGALPYATDGVVVKCNRYDIQKVLGSTAKAPRWAVAYKFKSEQAITKLLSIDYQVGRTGAVTPVANLEPVLLAGTTVRRASLHNADQIEMLDVRLDDMVYVEKGGEIIPKITGVELSSRSQDTESIQYLTCCPVCSFKLVRFEGEAKSYCPNQAGCAPQITGRIEHFVARKGMNIDGLGAETIQLLYDKGLIENISNLYDLRREQLLVLPRMGDKSANNIIKGVAESVNIPFARLLFALGIRFVGETTAKYLANHFKSVDALMAAGEEELMEADEVGKKIADSIIAYFADVQNLEIINRLRQAGLQFEAQFEELASTNLVGKSFVISGSFAKHSRDELKALIEKNGGKNLSAVSANTNYLVAGDKIGPAKLAKATKLGVEIISESQFIEMLTAISLVVPTEDVKIKTLEEKKENNITQGVLF